MRKFKRWKMLTSAVLVGASAITLTACGGGGSDSSTTAATTTGSSSGSATTSAAGTTTASSGSSDASDLSNTLVYAGEGTDFINPILSTHGELTSIVFDGLLKLDGNGKPVECLAESYEFDEASNKYTFKLRDGVKWHDGESFDADDVVYTYTTMKNDETISASAKSDYEDISDIKKVDDHTVEITLSQYNAAMPTYFSMGILPQHLYEGQDITTTELNQKPVGTGKYKLVSWDTDGGMITFEKNEDYFGNVPKIDRLVYKTVADETTKATMVQSGEADLAWLNSKYASTFDGKDGFTEWVFTTADYRGASMDMPSDFWKDNADSIGVLNYAIDKESIVKNVLVGDGETAYSPIQRNPIGTNKDADIYPYDVNKFHEEMEKLGWKKGSDGIYERNGRKFHFTIQTRDYEEERVDIANVMSDMLKQVGVDMEVVLVTKFDWKSGYDGFLAGFATEFDPDMVYKQFVTGASDNSRGYSNAEVDKLLKEGRYEKDEAKRKEIYGEFEKVYAENPSILLVVYLDGNYVGTNALTGLDTTRVLGHHAVGVMWNIEEWELNR